MQFSKKEGLIIEKALAHWQEHQSLSADDCQRLQQQIIISPFDWARLARYSFWIALACLFIAIGAVLADALLIELLETLFDAPVLVQALISALISAGFFYWGLNRRLKAPNKRYSNEALLFMGALFTAASITGLAEFFSTGSDHFSLVFLAIAFMYLVLGWWFPSVLVWVLGLVSLCSWLGMETGYASGWGAYYLGMNYPMRYVLFGLLLLGAGKLLFMAFPYQAQLERSTRIVGLLCLFIALWLMSIFGNYGDAERWQQASQASLFLWSLLFGVAAIAAIVHGLRFDDGMTRGFGLTFLGINLYTRYFEYFWDDLHHTLFFGLIGLSFWWLGKHAETIWQLGLKSKSPPSSAKNAQ